MAKRKNQVLKTTFYQPPKREIMRLEGAKPQFGDAIPVGVDWGNGELEAFAYVDEKLLCVRIPHGRVPVRGVGFDSDVMASGIDFQYSDFPHNGDTGDYERWAYGIGVEEATGKTIDANRNHVSRYGSSHQVWATINALNELGLKGDKPIILILTAPPGYVNEVSKTLKRAFMIGWDGQRDGKWLLRPKGSKKWIEYTIENVYVMPEGLPAWSAYRFNLDGSVAQLPDRRYPDDYRDALAGNVVTLDLGNGTADMYRIISGQVVTEDIIKATDPDGGIQERMIRPIRDTIMEQTGVNVGDGTVDHWLITWAMAGWKPEAAIVDVGGLRLHLHNTFERTATDYAEWIANNKLNEAFRRRGDAICTVGGGWLYVYNALINAYQNRLFIAPADFPHTRAIRWQDLNAYGAIVRWAAEERAAAEAAPEAETRGKRRGK